MEHNAYHDLRAFDRLGRRAQWRMIFAGTLVWYADAFRCPERLYPWLRRFPHFSLAEEIYYVTPKGHLTVSPSFRRHMMACFKRGQVFRAIEYYFAVRRPDLTLITTRPLYHLLGGNRRPILATVGAFFYTAFIVHPLILGVFLLGLWGFHQGTPTTPGWVMALRWGAIPVACGVVWVLIGVCTVTSKLARKPFKGE